MRYLITQTPARTLCSAAILGLVLAADLGAQDRPDTRRAPRARADVDQSRLFPFGATIGAAIANPTAEQLGDAKAPQAGGAVVVRVDPESPAAKAGLMAGDLVVEFDGDRVRSAQQLIRLVRETPPGRSVPMALLRDGNRRMVQVTPEERSIASAMPPFPPELGRDFERQLRDLPRRFNFRFDEDWVPGAPLGARGQLGATLSPLGEQLARYFGVKEGVLVTEVRANSVASRAGLLAGDVITQVGDTPVTRIGDVTARVRAAEPGEALTLNVTRDKKAMSLKVTMPPVEVTGRGRSI
jgi:serine protease Do